MRSVVADLEYGFPMF